jgi:hypothetical protein
MRNRAAHECNFAGSGYSKVADILTAPAQKALIFLASNRRANARPAIRTSYLEHQGAARPFLFRLL